MKHHSGVADEHAGELGPEPAPGGNLDAEDAGRETNEHPHHEHRDPSERQGVGDRKELRAVEVSEQKLPLSVEPDRAAHERHHCGQDEGLAARRKPRSAPPPEGRYCSRSHRPPPRSVDPTIS
jgi:hypothetical protein